MITMEHGNKEFKKSFSIVKDMYKKHMTKGSILKMAHGEAIRNMMENIKILLNIICRRLTLSLFKEQIWDRRKLVSY